MWIVKEWKDAPRGILGRRLRAEVNGRVDAQSALEEPFRALSYGSPDRPESGIERDETLHVVDEVGSRVLVAGGDLLDPQVPAHPPANGPLPRPSQLQHLCEHRIATLLCRAGMLIGVVCVGRTDEPGELSGLPQLEPLRGDAEEGQRS